MNFKSFQRISANAGQYKGLVGTLQNKMCEGLWYCDFGKRGPKNAKNKPVLAIVRETEIQLYEGRK